MATLTFNGKTQDVPDGSPIREAAESLGVPFGCKQGMCQTCKVTVTSGLENLAPKNDTEDAHELPDNERLCCQAVIQKGSVALSK